MEVCTLGIDLAKNVFRLHGVDAKGRTVLTRQLRRRQLLPFLAQLRPCLVGLEACGGAHYFAREMAVGDARQFLSGRELNAWLGLTPRQHSSGERTVLLGISKRGDRYLRTLLIHGARSALYRAGRKHDFRSEWIERVRKRRGMNIAAVALANKNARVLWALLVNKDNYRVRPAA